MKKIGFIIDNLLDSQISMDVMANAKESFIFTKELTPTSYQTSSCLMDISEIWGFDDGVLIATSLDTALFMEKAVCNSKKVFWIYDYGELSERTEKDRILSLINNKYIQIAVRSEYIKDKFEKQFNKTPIILGNVKDANTIC